MTQPVDNSAPSAGPAPTRDTSWLGRLRTEHRCLPWTLRRIIEVLLLALVVEYLLLPPLAGTRQWLSAVPESGAR